MWFRFFRLLRELEPNRHFGKLWLSQGLSLTAFNMVNFTLLIRVFDLSGSSLLVSLFVLSFGIPSLIFGAIAGVFADRWNRRSVLIVTNVLRTILVLLFIPALDSIPLIYLVTFAVATVTQFFTPAEAALIPELVERRRLVSANATFMLTMFGSFILGYGLAGPLAATGGDSAPILVAAVMFALATVACYALPRQTHLATHRVAVSAAYRTVMHSLREGFTTVRGSSAVRYGIAQLTFIWATIGVVMVVLPAFTSQVLELDIREVSRAVIIPIGVGMLGGGFLLHRLRPHMTVRLIIMLNLLVAGVAVVLLGQIRPVAEWLHNETGLFADRVTDTQQLFTAILAVLLGTAISVVMIASQTLIHEKTVTAVRGRIFGVLGMSINAANTFPVLLTGLLTDVFKAGTTVTAVGVIMLLWGLASYRLAGGLQKSIDTPHTGTHTGT